jgi:hypothetical protein
MTCRKCKEDSAHRVERKTSLDHTLNRISVKPYLCSSCSHRFYSFKAPVRARENSGGVGKWLVNIFDERDGGRARREATLYVLAGAVISVLIFYFTRPPA